MTAGKVLPFMIIKYEIIRRRIYQLTPYMM